METLERMIMLIVRRMGDPSLRDIVEAVLERSSWPTKEIEDMVKGLVRGGWLRMKEDTIDHDWTYKLTDSGKTSMEGEGAE